MNNFQTWPVPTSWRKPINEWEQTLIARSLSPETLRTRLAHIRRCARGLNRSPSMVTGQALLDYVSRKDWQPETRTSYYASLGQFFAWYSYKRGKDNPAEALPKVTRGQGALRPIPDAVLAQALEEVSPRERLMLSLAAFAGLRAGEIARVNVNDLTKDLLGDALLVHGKGNKQRVIPITEELANDIRNIAQPGTGWIFPGQDQGHVTSRWIVQLGARVLPGKWTLHTLRHRFGTHAYAGDRDLVAVQRLLGHASVATTQRYVEPPSDAMRRAANAAQGLN